MPKLTRKAAIDAWNHSVGNAKTPGRWSTGLLILSSAALGGIAVALWNRQSLAKMRLEADDSSASQPGNKKTFADEFEGQ